MDAEEWFLQGLKSTYPEAQKAYFERGLGLDPTFQAFAWVGIGMSAFARGDLLTAEDAAHRALQIDPVHKHALCFLGDIARARHDVAKAISIYEEVYAKNPHYVVPLLQLGIINAIQKDLPRATQFIEQALTTNPAFFPTHTTLAFIQFLKREDEGAIKSLQRALELDPHAPGPLYEIGKFFLEKKDYTRASAFYQKFLERQPASLAALTNLGFVHRAQGDLPGAILQLAKCVNADVDYSPAFTALLSTYWEKDRFSLIQAQIRDAEQLSPKNPDTWVLMGTSMGYFGDLERATAYFSRAVEINPRFPVAHLCLGLAYRGRNRLPESVNAYKHALDINPASGVLGNRPGPLQWKNNVPGAMAAISKQTVDLHPDDPVVWNSYGCALLAERSSQSDRATYQTFVRKAVVAFERAIGLDPTFVAAWCNLGDLTRGAASIQSYKKALAIAPDDIVAWYHLGTHMPKTDEQIVAFSHVIKIEPRVIEMWNRLGIELERRSRLPEALYCWEQSAKLGNADGRKWVADANSQGIISKTPDFLKKVSSL